MLKIAECGLKDGINCLSIRNPQFSLIACPTASICSAATLPRHERARTYELPARIRFPAPPMSR
jgi:hypothetical protein